MTLPALHREYAVQMTCDGCASAVRGALDQLAQVQSVSVFLDRGTVLVTGDVPVDDVLAAVEATGRAVRLVGSGSASDTPLLSVPPLVGVPHESTAAVAEFKGTAYGHGPVYGTMRLVQLTGTSVSHTHAWMLPSLLTLDVIALLQTAQRARRCRSPACRLPRPCAWQYTPAATSRTGRQARGFPSTTGKQETAAKRTPRAQSRSAMCCHSPQTRPGTLQRLLWPPACACGRSWAERRSCMPARPPQTRAAAPA